MNKKIFNSIRLLSVVGFVLAFFLALNISVFAVENGNNNIPAEGEVIEAELEIKEPAVTSNNLAEPEELLDDYIEVLTKEYAESHDAVSFEAKDGIVQEKLRGSRLTGAEKRVYDYLKERIEEIARGDNIDEENESNNGLTSFVVDFNAIFSPEELAIQYSSADLGVEVVVNGEINDDAVEAVSNHYNFDMRKVLTALLCDYPYHLFWFDKTSGVVPNKICVVGATYSYKNREWKAYCVPEDSTVTFYLAVSKEYAPTTPYAYNFNGSVAPIQTDVNKIRSLGIAVDNAMNVVTAASNKNTDYDKLDYYRKWICDEVVYNNDAMEQNWDYGDPWQLIYVFDGKEDTNAIVCEGYSKAFKYLCDLTNGFDDTTIDCRLVSGVMAGGRGAGDHMWNILELGGKNYLVDVTNCDSGTIGADRKLFMVGNNNLTTEQVTERGVTVTSEKYTFTNDSHNLSFDVTYTYDVDTVNSFDESERLLSSTNYNPCTHNYQEVPNSAVPATCTKDGREASKECSKCHNVIEGKKINKLGHDYHEVEDSAQAATCTAEGKEANKKCSRCDDIQTGKVIPAKGHTEVVIPAVPATCTQAGKTAGKECSDCNAILEAPQDTNALGHDWNDGVVTTPATCKKTGTMTFTCNHDSSHTKTEDIDVDPDAHSYGAWEKFDDDQHQRVCTHDASHVEKKDHSWNDGEVTTPATDKVEGVKTITCTVCKATKTEAIPKTKPVTKPTGTVTILNTIANSAKKQNDVIWDKSKVKNATNYEINWKTRGSGKWVSKTVGNTVRGTTTGLTIKGLYEIRVRPKNTAGDGAWSNTVYRYFHTTEKIRLTSKSKGTFTMSWKKNPQATGYQVLYTTNKNGTGAAQNIKTAGASATSITVNNIKVNGKTQRLKSGTTYYVQIREIKKVGNTTYIGNISCPVAVRVK